MLSTEEKERYSRHLLLDQVGEKGQEKIKKARVLVIGAGGLGSPALLYLAAAGIGHIGIVDDDRVSESNLQRQVLYDTGCVGEYKVDIAAKKLRILNPHCHITTYPFRLDALNAAGLIERYDVIVDATDNLLARYVIDNACMICKRPFVYGSICEFNGQVSVFNYKEGPAYRDLYEYHDEVPAFKQPLGVIGALPGVIGSIQAAETLKIILGQETLSGKLLLVDLLSNTFNTINIR